MLSAIIGVLIIYLEVSNSELVANSANGMKMLGITWISFEILTEGDNEIVNCTS